MKREKEAFGIPEPWTVISTKKVYESKVMVLKEHESVSAGTGNKAVFSVIECPAWVNIIALTKNRDVVLIRQYRAGSREVGLEIPGGMMDPEDKSPMDAARRELLEETGFSGRNLREIGRIRPNPAFLNNFCYTYLVEDVEKIAEPSLDSSEELYVECRPLESIPGLIAEGTIDHSLVVTAFTWFFGFGERLGMA